MGNSPPPSEWEFCDVSLHKKRRILFGKERERFGAPIELAGILGARAHQSLPAECDCFDVPKGIRVLGCNLSRGVNLPPKVVGPKNAPLSILSETVANLVDYRGCTYQGLIYDYAMHLTLHFWRCTPKLIGNHGFPFGSLLE